MKEELRVVRVEPHGRRNVTMPMFHVVLQRAGFKALDVYLTAPEMEGLGIEVPEHRRLGVVR